MKIDRITIAVLVAVVTLILSPINLTARTWTESELREASKDDWIWSDKKFEKMDTIAIFFLDGVETAPAVRKWSKPLYPPKAKRMDIFPEGDVSVGIVLDEQGKVIHVRILEDSGSDVGFEKATVDAFRRSKWEPALNPAGNAVPVFFTYTQKFRFLTTKGGDPIVQVTKWDWVVERSPEIMPDEPDTSDASESTDTRTDSLPDPDEFVDVEVQPEQTKRANPRYPEAARRAGIQGTVWVKVLVDSDGKVREAIVMKESGYEVGFEEAALKSAIDCEWKPAKSGGKPVALWVAYEVRFQLRRGR